MRTTRGDPEKRRLRYESSANKGILPYLQNPYFFRGIASSPYKLLRTWELYPKVFGRVDLGRRVLVGNTGGRSLEIVRRGSLAFAMTATR